MENSDLLFRAGYIFGQVEFLHEELIQFIERNETLSEKESAELISITTKLQTVLSEIRF